MSNERDQQGEQRRRTVQYASLGTFLAIVVVAVLIAVSQSGGGSKSPPSDLRGASQVSSQLQGIPQNGTVLGDPNAKVTVVEFGDLQCPICREFSSQEAPQLISQARQGQIKYELRIWPIIGPQSKPAGEAALAAAAQARYWQFVQLFYANQGSENSGYVTDTFLESIAKGAGVPDINRWNADRKSGRFDAVLAKNNSDAGSLGFSGTPSVLVQGPNGHKPFGGNTVPTLAEIEAAIKAGG